MIECSWKSWFGAECLTCGFQRSLELLLKGNFLDSFYMFPATLPLVATFILALLHIKFNYSKGALWIVSLFSLSAFLMVVNFSIKLSSGEVFHDLAFH